MPHAAAKACHSATDGRAMRHPRSATSQQKRKLIDEAFGLANIIAGVAKGQVARPRSRTPLLHARHDGLQYDLDAEAVRMGGGVSAKVWH